MKKFALLTILILAHCAFAQTTYGRLDFSLQNAQGQAISGAQINVYTQSTCGAPAGALATLYSTALGPAATPPANVPLTQPLITDGFGHQFAYAAQGCVTITYNSPYTGLLTYPDQNVIAGTSISGCGTSTPCTIPQGGTDATTAHGAAVNLGIPAANVVQFGAVGDGTTNNCTAVQNAISASPGGRVYVPYALLYYSVGSACHLTVTAGTTIEGDGACAQHQTSCVSVISSTDTTGILWTVTGIGPVNFRHIAFLNTAATVTAGAAIYANSSSYTGQVNLDDVYIDNFYDDADLWAGGQWTSYQSSFNDPWRDGLSIQDTVVQDAGNWTLNDAWCTTQTPASGGSAHTANSCVKITGGNGGTINNLTVVGAPGQANTPTYGIDIAPTQQLNGQTIEFSNIQEMQGVPLELAGTSGKTINNLQVIGGSYIPGISGYSAIAGAYVTSSLFMPGYLGAVSGSANIALTNSTNNLVLPYINASNTATANTGTGAEDFSSLSSSILSLDTYNVGIPGINFSGTITPSSSDVKISPTRGVSLVDQSVNTIAYLESDAVGSSSQLPCFKIGNGAGSASGFYLCAPFGGDAGVWSNYGGGTLGDWYAANYHNANGVVIPSTAGGYQGPSSGNVQLAPGPSGAGYLYQNGSGTYSWAAASGAFSGGLGSSYQDVTEIAAPSDPASGNDRLYLNSTTHLLTCLTSGGGSCMPSGTFSTLTGDASSTSTGGATEVIGILNHTLPSLTSGFLQWNGSALVWGTSTGPTLQTNGVNNSSQTALNFLTSSVNACGLVWTPSNPSAGGEQGEISGTYSCTISSSQVTTALGYTPANCTAGLSANNCAKLNSSGLLPLANQSDYPAPFAVPAANCVSGSPGSAWSTTIAPSCRAGAYNLGGNLPFADGNTAQFEIPIPADWDSAANAYARLNFTTGANTSGTIIFQIQISCYTTGNSETDDQAFQTAQVFPTKTAASANYANSVTLTLNSTSLTGCAATGGMIVKITRNTDTAASVVPVTKAIITLNRTLANEAQ
jgi:hypothetical protein